MHEKEILYAEDDENDAFSLTRAFLNIACEHALTVVRDGDQAIERLKISTPDLLLLDIRMPNRSGLEVLSWLRTQAPPLYGLPTIIISASPAPAHRDAARDLGALGYFGKWADTESLEQFVTSICAFLDDESPTRKWRCPRTKDCYEFYVEAEA